MAKLKKKWRDDQERLGSFKVYPNGEYIAKVVKSSVEKTNAGDGKYMKYTWQFIKGDFKGKEHAEIINHENPNSQAEEIADKAIASMCDAMGIKPSKFTDTKQAHNIPCRITLTTNEAKGKYSESNSISVYESMKKGKGKDKGKGKKPF